MTGRIRRPGQRENLRLHHTAALEATFECRCEVKISDHFWTVAADKSEMFRFAQHDNAV